jgi:hypothetical protein
LICILARHLFDKTRATRGQHQPWSSSIRTFSISPGPDLIAAESPLGKMAVP